MRVARLLAIAPLKRVEGPGQGVGVCVRESVCQRLSAGKGEIKGRIGDG